MEVRKEVIRSGRHVYINQDGKPAVLDATPDKIDHYYRSGLDMLKDGLPIPVPLEHQPTATPMNAMDRAANLVRNNVGEVKRFEKDVVKVDGQDVHRLLSVVDIKDDGIANSVKNGSIRWCSPWINSFTDGKGKNWNEVISHVALTTRPRIHDQQAFENVSMALSLAAPAEPPKDGFFLSRAGLLKPDGKPVNPIAFSLLVGVPLSSESIHGPDGKFTGTGGSKVRKKRKKKKKDVGKKSDYAESEWSKIRRDAGKKSDYVASKRMSVGDDELADDEEWDDDEELYDDSDTDSDTPPDPAAGAMADDAGVSTDVDAGDVSFEELIPHLLELHGISVPAGGKGKEFLQALVQGLLASAKSLAANDGGADANVLGDNPDPNAPDPNQPPKGPIKQESPPMYMSLTKAEIEKIADPKEKQVAEAFFSMRQTAERYKAQADAAAKNILAEETQKRNARIERICRRLPAVARDKILAQVSAPSMQLSLIDTGTDAGKVRDPMAVMLDVFEAGIPDLPAMLKGATFSEQQHPSDDGTLTDQQAEDLANRMTRRLSPAGAA